MDWYLGVSGSPAEWSPSSLPLPQPTGSSGGGCLSYGLVKMVPKRSLATALICIDLILELQRQDTTVRVSLGKDGV